MEIKKFSTNFAGKELIIETGRFADQANAAITVQMGETVVLVTAVLGEPRDGMDFFPLMVDYEEKLYAAGRIKGSRFIKREGRPSDEAVLVSRFIDRAIRPLFDNRIRNNVQVICTVLSFDEENDPDILGLIGASCALHISDIPWNGPIGAVRTSQIGDEWLFNASYEQRKDSAFDLDIAGTTEKVVMIEARANEVPEDVMAEAFKRGKAELAPVIELIEKMRAEIGTEKAMLIPDEDPRKKEVEDMSKAFMSSRMEDLFFSQTKASKQERGEAKNRLKAELVEHLLENGVSDDEVWMGTSLIYDFIQIEVARAIIESGKRLDGRGIEDVRDLTIEAGILPRVHGCGHFSRGETQILSIATLGAPGDQQTLDNMETVGEKRYMHHYNFPPFSVGEARPLRGAGRREIGHGALAEKALEPVLPAKEDFPYAIRVVSETMNSNGSSSMASTCASTLALMDAGVPITAPVAGIAIGLASIGEEWKVITDIQDLEDGPGGMDFKVTGTKDGITAIQMDTKTHGLTQEMIEEALRQSKKARANILDQMTAVIAEPRAELSPYAPSILTLEINPDKIREVIGPGGKMINEIIEKTGVQAIDIEQNGLVMITAPDQESGKAAYDWVHNLTREVEVGEAFDGEVVRIMDFGAFVNILPGKDGMVHVSELAPWRVEKVEDIVKLGDKVKVKVIEIDDMGRINLSMKQAEGNVYTDEMKAKAQKRPEKRPEGRSGDKKPRHNGKPRKRHE